MSSLVTFQPAVLEKKSFEEIVDDARTDGRTDARTTTNDGQRRTPVVILKVINIKYVQIFKKIIHANKILSVLL